MVDDNKAAVSIRYDNHKAEVESKHFTALFNHLVGDMCTIVEAAISDREQRRAIKELTKRTIWSNMDALQNWLHHESNKATCNCKEHPEMTFPF